MPSVVALIPARSGSERVRDKNIRPLAGHPLLAYAIASARQAGIFDRIVCSTDSGKIAEVAQRYGADIPFLRPAEFATSTSPDIEWITHALEQLDEHYDLFAIVRATNPFRGPDVLRRGLEQLLATPGGRLDPRRRARQTAPGEDVGGRRKDDAAAARPIAPRRRLARGPVPGAARDLRAEQRARDCLDARRLADRDARGACRRAVLHARPRGLQHRRRGGLGAGAAAARRR